MNPRDLRKTAGLLIKPPEGRNTPVCPPLTGCPQVWPQRGKGLRRWPIGPQAQKRPGNVVGCAVRVARIATGEVTETPAKERQPRKAAGGMVGGRKRAELLSPDRRSEIASLAAKARWET